MAKNIREEMKATLSKRKKNPQGTKTEGKEAAVETNNFEHKEEIKSQPAQNREIRIQKNEVRTRRLYNIYKLANIQIIGMPEGEEEEQEIENLFEK